MDTRTNFTLGTTTTATDDMATETETNDLDTLQLQLRRVPHTHTLITRHPGGLALVYPLLHFYMLHLYALFLHLITGTGFGGQR